MNARPRVFAVATARPTFAVDAARERAVAARGVLEGLDADIVGPTDLVMSADDVAAARASLSTPPDLVVVVCATFSDATAAVGLVAGFDAPVVCWSFPEPGRVGERLWLNSLCGANLVGHALGLTGRAVHLVYGEPQDARVREVLADAVAGRLPAPTALVPVRGERGDEELARAALATIHGRVLGVIGDAPPGFTPSEYDEGLLKELFGLSVAALPIEEVFERIDAVPGVDRDAELAAVVRDRPSLTDLDPGQVREHAAVTSALRGWRDGARLDALAVRCWPEFPTQRGICPCSSLSRIADEGTPTVCERDVYGAVTMVMLEALGAGTTYLVDTVDLDAERGIVRLWHCGAAATSLVAQGQEATQSVHCNRKVGVAGDFPLRTGPVTMARLTQDPEGNPGGAGLRLLIASGESIPAPNRFQGNTADVRLDIDASAFVHALVSEGFPHHTVLAWTDVRPALRAAADLLGIRVVEWADGPAVVGERRASRTGESA